MDGNSSLVKLKLDMVYRELSMETASARFTESTRPAQPATEKAKPKKAAAKAAEPDEETSEKAAPRKKPAAKSRKAA